MLQNDEKKKIEQYICKISTGIFSEAQKSIQSGMSNKQVVDRVIEITVNKFTPESKMIMSSTYNMMMKHTLAGSFFQTSQNKAAFYEMDILKDLNRKFNFEVPQNIDYEESKKEINKWIKAGTVVVVVGCIISISMDSFIPVGIAVVIAGIMAFLLKDVASNKHEEINNLIQEYLDGVKKSLMYWIDSIEKYYDEQVADLERKLVG